MKDLLFRIAFRRRGRTSLIGTLEYWLYKNSETYQDFYWQAVWGRPHPRHA